MHLVDAQGCTSTFRGLAVSLQWSIHGGRKETPPWTLQTPKPFSGFLEGDWNRLDEVSTVAKAAEACAEAGKY